MKKINQPLVPNSKGNDVANLQEALLFLIKHKVFKAQRAPNRSTAANLRSLFSMLAREQRQAVYGKATAELISIFQNQQGLGDHLKGIVEARTAKLLNGLLKELGAFSEIDDNTDSTDTVERSDPVIVTSDGKNEKKYLVSGRILNSNGAPLAGYLVQLFIITLQKDALVGHTESDENGAYTIEYKNQTRTDPDIQVRAFKKGDEKNIFRSPTKFNASSVEKLDVIIAAGREKVTSEFSRIISSISQQLNDVKISSLREDSQRSDITYISNKTGLDSRITAMMTSAHQLGEKLKIEPEHVYALLRAGVPATESDIKSISIDNAKTIIGNAVKQNVISNNNTEATIKTLEGLSIDHLLNFKADFAVSTMGEMLSLRLNGNEKSIFAQTQKQVGDDNAGLWRSLAQKGFSAQTISQLQLDGKMGFLTGNNVPLVQKMYKKYNLKSDVDLARNGLYNASEWKKIIGTNVPEGLTADEYAAHLARQVERSFPTAVLAQRLVNDEIKVGKIGSKDELTSFLNSNESKYNIGVQQIKSWDGYNKLSDEAKSAVKTLERIYQITPSDESMIALSNAGLTSAYEIARYTKTEFIAKHGESFPNTKEAEMIYMKANEVYSSALGIATTYLTTRTMPNVYSITGKKQKEQNEIVASPTLEELLGNMDYCDCDHCKSVLSPAAYLVELLQFIDLEKVEHTKSNPIDALKERRPDIENIQLSCENTNMALPYIDLVNEILEYYIINGNLTDLKGHDVLEGTSQSELLAEPQFVNKAAYDLLKTKVFPFNLPFHQPLETLRRLFQMWDVSLEKMLSVFSSGLLSRKEALALNEDEYKTLTDITFKNLPEYFGEPAGNTIGQLNAAISGGKAFCRRLDLKYEDLIVLLETNFINPGFKLVTLFKTLHLNLSVLNKFYLGEITDDELDALIPAETNPEDFGGDIKQWLRDNEKLIMGLVTLTDVGPEIAECNFADVELRFALPDNANNSLTTIVYRKFHRFLRLLQKTGWSIETLDYIIEVLLPVSSDEITEVNIDEVFVQLLDRIANFKKIVDLLNYSTKKYKDLLLVLNKENDAELRQTQCAKIVKLSIPEFNELKIISGVDPLADDMEADEPSLMKFIQTAHLLKAVSLKIADLSYIVHHSDITGKLTPTGDSLLASIKILRDTLNAVEEENSAAPDNADFNFAKGKMQLVYDAATADSFFELLMGSKNFTAPLITGEEGLSDKIKNVDSNLDFDAFKKEITFSGVMSNAVKTDFESAADSLVLADMDVITTQPELDTFIVDFKTAVGQIFAESTAFINDFASRFPELKVIYDAVITETTPEAQIKKLVELILPELKSKLKTNGLQQALISILKTDPDTVGVLTSGNEVLNSETDATKSVLYDFTALETPLVFDQNQTYTFYLDVPATDDYLIYLKAPENTVLTLSINSSEIISGLIVGSDKEVKNATPLSLETGKLHRVELTLASLPLDEVVTMLWRTKGMEKSLIPVSAMYGVQQVNSAITSLIRLSKSAQLQSLLKFTPFELEYFASTNVETKGLLNELDTDGTISNAELQAYFEKIERVMYFNLLKKENEPEENTWLQVLLYPSVKNSQGNLLLESFNYWNEPDLVSILAHFGLSRGDLSKPSELKKVADAMNSMREIYYPAADILTWVTNDPSYELVTGIKSMVKQKVTETSWLESMQTVNDPVRNLLRDALVNYILQYSTPSPEITDADKLYEYFLIDVEMDACMKTSRIRQALSTVQLFIQRCLMNLEPLVDPASIRADHWVWMKRYRVWEANRKVFLYPENWLEPELRDGKSYLFKELEGELLQAEITDESAELAFLNYLKKLDDIAKLDIVGMYLQENEEKNQYDDILHVIGRTNGNTRQYFHRRFEKGYWTPWEKINLNIEGDDVFPIIWRKQLFIFWLNIIEKATEGDRSKNAQTISNEAWGNHAKRNVEVNICWGEYFNGKWTSPKSTEMKRPMVISNLAKFESNKLLIYGRIETPPGKFRERLIIYIRYRGEGATSGIFTFTTKNAPPFFEFGDDSILYNKVRDNLNTAYFEPYNGTDETTELYYTQFLMPGKDFKVNVKQPFGTAKPEITESLISKKNLLTKGFKISPTWHPVENQFEAALMYADEHSTFYIQADESKYTPIRIFDGYYPVQETPPKYFEIPELVEKPIPGWPPEEFSGIGDDVVINNPWNWNEQAVRTNANYKVVLPTEDTFVFGDAIFDTGGKTFQSF